MFIPKTPAENTILRSYLYNEEATTFEDQSVILNIHINTLLRKVPTWKCPKSNTTRQIMSADNWEKERQALLAYGNNLLINTKALLCGTFHNKNTGYLVWLEFTGPDRVMHKLDCFINDSDCEVIKVVDGIDCETVYADIINNGSINPSVARKLNSIGSITWQGSAEAKTQYKLNSFREQKCFEKVAAKCPFVELKQLDCFDNFLYRGDPGCLADYDLTLILKNGARLTTRVDLKLLNDLSTIADQQKKAHDAELLIASALLTPETQGYWVKAPSHAIHIENTEEFQKFMRLFEEELAKESPQYIKIHSIDTDTGRVIYDFFN